MVRTRIAPSPTGDPHVGTLYQVIFNFALARKSGGKFILRIEDTDRARYVTGSIEKIYEYLKWCNLEPDESPLSPGPYGPYIQSERIEIYRKYVNELLNKGHAYYCFCSKERLEEMRAKQIEEKTQPKYDRFCLNLTIDVIEKNLSEKKEHVIRMKVPDNEIVSFEDMVRGKISFNTNQIDDQIILKSDGFPTYHLAVVIDDHLMEISDVIRAEEWIPSTPKQILLYKYFGWNLPNFIHTQSLRGNNKKKLGKRNGDVSIQWFKDEGFLSEALINYLGLIGCPNNENKDIFDMDYFISNFSTKKISKTGPVFDSAKLEWMNGVYIRNMSVEELAQRIRPFIKELNIEEKSNEFFHQSLLLIQERLKKLSEADELLELFYIRPSVKPNEYEQILNDMYNLIKEYLDKDGKETEDKIREYAVNNNMKTGEVFTLLRDTITGKKATPPLVPVMKVLGKEETLIRIKNSIGE